MKVNFKISDIFNIHRFNLSRRLCIRQLTDSTCVAIYRVFLKEKAAHSGFVSISLE